jgi:hypothetical protein
MFVSSPQFLFVSQALEKVASTKHVDQCCFLVVVWQLSVAVEAVMHLVEAVAPAVLELLVG